MYIPHLLLYCFFSWLVLQIYANTGFVALLWQVYSLKSLKSLSQLLINCFLPIFQIIETARMATRENMEIFWIIIVSMIASMIISYSLCSIFQHLFKLDLRIKNSFALLVFLPDVAVLPLVFIQAFCFPGGIYNKIN